MTASPRVVPLFLTVAGVLVMMGLSGCTGAEESASRSTPPRAGDVLPLTRGSEGEAWFAAPSMGGDTVSVADLRGSPVLINLWATWCLPCREEIPYLQSLHTTYTDLEVIGVSVDDRGAREQVRSFAETHGVTFTILLDPTMRSLDLFGVPGLPATFLVKPDGTVTFSRIGPIMEGDVAFEEALETLMAERTGSDARAGGEGGP